jgi:predicted Zn-dependent peptidase
MYKKTVLKNGLTVILESIPHVRSVTMGFWVKAGAVYETIENNGICHFIEHLMFKGTKKRDPKEIASTLDRVGGQLNAFSSKEFTCYYAKVIDQHIDIALELLSDLLLNSVFNEKEIEREKKVIIEEIKMYEDAPDELVHEMFSQNLWKNSSWGQPILGTEEIINRIQRDDIVNFYKDFYTPGNTIVSIAGNFDHARVIQKLEELFEESHGSAPLIEIGPPKVNKGSIVKAKDIEQVHLCMGFPGVTKFDTDKYALTILSIALGGGMSSRLFQEIREKRGLVYTIYCYQTDYKTAGLFNVYAGFSKENLQPLIDIVIKELDSVSKKGFDADELLRAREQLKGSMIMGLESTNNRMSRNARLEIYYNEHRSIDDLIKEIDQVENDDVMRVMQRLYSRDQLLLTAIGPITGDDINF